MISNAVLENMKTRFSCRKFKADPVENEKLEAILEAATFAASGHNMQAWHFTVITTEEGKKELLEAVGPEPEDFKQKEHPGPSPPTFSGLRLSS